MKTYFECFPCFVKQALRAARLFTDDPKVIKSIIDEVVMLFPEISLDKTPPEIGEFIYGKIREISGVEDPYENLKNQNTDEALHLVPFCENLISESTDPLFTAIKLAIAGNVIDLAIHQNIDIPSEIKTIIHKEFAINDYELFKSRLEQSKTILYIGDNAGESVFDRLLIEQFAHKKVIYAVRGTPVIKVIYAVRGTPVINDVVEKDAKRAGIDKFAEIISSGSATPGIILSKCSEEFKDIFMNADMIISKGQGNYEGISEESREIFFLLKVKCEVLARDIGFPINSLVLMESLPCSE
ncbi:MAG: ARMT1-like domain-containing protein [Candidatus Celaenobacter polaris]|nr:ARMT1-like domain-containing protein [Candidatus Celaenobacter polaris]